MYKLLKILSTAKFIDAMYKKVFTIYGFSFTIVNNKDDVTKIAQAY